MRHLIQFGLIIFLFSSCGQKNNQAESKTIQYAGLYDLGGDIEEGPVGSVIVYSETDNTILFYLDVNRGAPSYNMGQIYGRVSIENNKGIFDKKMPYSDNRCKLLFEFKNDTLTIEYLDGQEDCGFGFSVWAAGEYKRQNSLQPEYFEDVPGKPIYFNKVSPEEYNKDSE